MELLISIQISFGTVVLYLFARSSYRKGFRDGVNSFRDYLIAGLPPTLPLSERIKHSLELRVRAIAVRAEGLGVKEGKRVP